MYNRCHFTRGWAVNSQSLKWSPGICLLSSVAAIITWFTSRAKDITSISPDIFCAPRNYVTYQSNTKCAPRFQSAPRNCPVKYGHYKEVLLANQCVQQGHMTNNWQWHNGRWWHDLTIEFSDSKSDCIHWTDQQENIIWCLSLSFWNTWRQLQNKTQCFKACSLINGFTLKQDAICISPSTSCWQTICRDQPGHFPSIESSSNVNHILLNIYKTCSFS